MPKLLTVAIPTYNRAVMLDEQLAWFASEIKGHEEDCDLVINDNCSTDNTTEIITKWQSALSPAVKFTHNRHAKNIGGMANIVASIQAATGNYVWTLGDDDPIDKGTLAYILTKLKQDTNLTLLLLNGFGRDKRTNQILVRHWFNSSSDNIHEDKKEFEYFLDKNMGGVLFISSAIYDTKLAQEALQNWPDSHLNLAAQAYWVAYCAAGGGFVVTADLKTECAMGIGFTDKDPRWSFKLQFRDIPEVYLKLMKSGYSKKFCFLMILKSCNSRNKVKVWLGATRRWPFLSAKISLYYAGSVVVAAWKTFISR
jgi:abequosyltransferase